SPKTRRLTPPPMLKVEVMRSHSYSTPGNVSVQQTTTQVPAEAVEDLIDSLSDHRGVMLCSSYEVPGRYTRWDVGFVNPPLVITARSMRFEVSALNERGVVLLGAIRRGLENDSLLELDERSARTVTGQIAKSKIPFSEEQRSRQPSIFSLLRRVID